MALLPMRSPGGAMGNLNTSIDPTKRASQQSIADWYKSQGMDVTQGGALGEDNYTPVFSNNAPQGNPARRIDSYGGTNPQIGSAKGGGQSAQPQGGMSPPQGGMPSPQVGSAKGGGQSAQPALNASMTPAYGGSNTGEGAWWQQTPYNPGIGLQGYSTGYDNPWFSLPTSGGQDTQSIMNQIYNPTANNFMPSALADYGNMMNSRYNPYSNPVWGMDNPNMSSYMGGFGGFPQTNQQNPLQNPFNPVIGGQWNWFGGSGGGANQVSENPLIKALMGGG